MTLYRVLYDEIGPIDKELMMPISVSLKDLESEMRVKLGNIDLEDIQSDGSDTDVSEDDLEDEIVMNLLP